MNEEDTLVRKLETVQTWYSENTEGEYDITIYRAHQLLKKLEKICKDGKE